MYILLKHHTTITPSLIISQLYKLGHCVLLVEEKLLPLDGYNIPFGEKVQVSSTNHAEGPKAIRLRYIVEWIALEVMHAALRNYNSWIITMSMSKALVPIPSAKKHLMAHISQFDRKDTI